MNLSVLRTFVAVADAGGVHRGAARRNLSQPAVSRQLRALETELGVPLFDRIGRRIRLTSEGEDLLPYSRRVLSDAELLMERAATLKKGDSGILRIGATPQVVESTLAPFLGEYHRRYPGIDIRLVEDGGVRLPNRLADGDVQLALTATPEQRFSYRPLYPVLGVAVMSTKHRLARRRTLEVAALREEPMLLLNATFLSRAWFDAACAAARFRPRLVLESGAPGTLIALAELGYGIAVIPTTVEVPGASVSCIPLTQSGRVLGRWLTVASETGRLLPAYAERFVEELAAHCARSYPGRALTKRVPPPPR